MAIYRLHDIALEVPDGLLTPVIRAALESGRYEAYEIAAARKAIRPGDRVLEIGAGIGLMSSFVMKVLGASSVCAVEADADLIPVIRHNHRLNHVAATVLHGAAGRHDGSIAFHKHDDFWASSTVVHSAGRRVVMTPCLSGSRLIAEKRPDVLIVDIEGRECEFFDELEMPTIRCAIVEMHRQQTGFRRIAQCFRALGAAGLAYDPAGSGGGTVVFTRSEGRAGTAFARRLTPARWLATDLVEAVARWGRSAP